MRVIKVLRKIMGHVLQRPISAALIIFLVAACSKQPSPPHLVLYTDTPESLAHELSALFERESGIHVEPVLEGTSWLMSRLRSERYRPIADVFMGASGTVPAVMGTKEGLFVPFIPGGLQSLPERSGKLLLRDRDWRWVGFGFAALGLAYSKKYTPTETLPATWQELANSRWHKALTIWDPSVSGTATLFLAASIQRAIANGKDEAEGWEFLHGFYKNIRKYAEEGPPAFAVAQGIVRLGVHLDNQFIYYKAQVASGKEDLEFYLPPQSAILTDPVALVAGAPHAEEAKRFIEFLLSPSAQAALSYYFWTRDPKGMVRLPFGHPYVQGDNKKTADELLALALSLDFDWMAAHFDQIRIYWQNHIEE